MKRLSIPMLGALVLLTTAMAMAGSIPEARFKYTTFNVPSSAVASVDLGIEQINNLQTIVGYYGLTTNSPGPFRGFVYFPFQQQLVTLIDPKDVEGVGEPFGGVTYALGENDTGVIVGQYWDTVAGAYAGYFLRNGKYQTYNAPGYTNTAVSAINDRGDFAGYAENSGIYYGFSVINGTFNPITIPGAILVESQQINNLGEVSGSYLDGSDIWHGFLLEKDGTLTIIDVPGGFEVAGLGTVVIGLNDFGTVSGHFWDSSAVEHGFYRTKDGHFYQVDVPGAAFTSGGGLNDFGVMVGHFTNTSGIEIGYIAIPY